MKSMRPSASSAPASTPILKLPAPLNLGLALKLKDDNAAAIPELEAAAKLNPSAHEPHYTLGILYMQDGRYDDAARELSQAMKLHPDNADGWATLGSLYQKMNKLPEAADALREAIRQRPDQPDSHLTLATVLAQQGNATEAAAERKKGAELERVAMNRQRATVSTNTGNSLLQKGADRGCDRALPGGAQRGSQLCRGTSRFSQGTGTPRQEGGSRS